MKSFRANEMRKRLSSSAFDTSFSSRVIGHEKEIRIEVGEGRKR
jgi:hypothetical protein